MAKIQTTQIRLTRGFSTVVDRDTGDKFGRLNWCVKPHGRTFYAMRSTTKGPNRRTTIYLHRAIMGPPLDGLEVDHIDGNGLNNRRSNLRVVTRLEQMQNQFRHRKGETPGVSWDKSRNKWIVHNKGHFVGRFSSKVEATRRAK